MWCGLQGRLTFSSSQSLGCLQWPLLPGGDEPQPPNAELRLYGGAAFERAVAEFQEAARLLAMPPGTVLGFEYLGFKVI